MKRAPGIALLLLAAAPALAQTTIPWDANAIELRGRDGEQVSFRCPPGGTIGSIWGTDLYSDDSSVCTAAVHAVAGLSAAAGFDVVIEIRPGAESYHGTTRFGVTSGDWDAWEGSFLVRSAGGVARTTNDAKAPQAIDWSTNATTMRDQQGAQIRVTCPPRGSAGAIWGTDVYSDDSSICTAAVHAGRMSFADGGTVTLQMTGPRVRFDPSTRNGVTSGAWGEWPGSFVFVGAD